MIVIKLRNTCYFPIIRYVSIVRVIITFIDDRFLLITLDLALFDKLLFLGSNTVKKNACRLIIGILRNELAFDSEVKYLGFGELYGGLEVSFVGFYGFYEG